MSIQLYWDTDALSRQPDKILGWVGEGGRRGNLKGIVSPPRGEAILLVTGTIDLVIGVIDHFRKATEACISLSICC